MPNLAGIFSFSSNCGNLRERISKMENILSYHDWYSKYFHIQENVGVINVSNGVFGLSNQPIFNEKGDLWLMMEGEVYDSDNLRKELINKGHKISGEGYDECILHLYEEIGDRFVHRINGQFVVVIHSIPDGKLLIVNDRLGFRPLYYYRSKDEFVFSSEMKGVLCAVESSNEIDDVSLMNYIFFGYNLGDKTLLKDIKILPAASIVEIDKKGFSMKKYWSMRFFEGDEEKKLDYYVEGLGELFKKAVKRCSQGRFGLSLSGGLDSRVVAGAFKLDNKSIYTYTYGDPRSLDVKYAKRIAKAIDAENELFIPSGNYVAEMADQIVWHNEGNLSILHCKSFPFQQQLKDKIDVLLTGHLGDILLGFWISRKLINANERQLVESLLENHRNFKDVGAGMSIFSDDYISFFKEKTRESFRSSIAALGSTGDLSPANIVQVWNLDNRQRRFILAATSIDKHLFEIRTPFADYDLIDFILEIPGTLRYNYYVYKKMVAKIFPFLCGIPWEKTELKVTSGKNREKILGTSIKAIRVAERKLRKIGIGIEILSPKGFLDFDSIFRKDQKTRTFLSDTLLNSKTFQRPYFSPKGLEALLNEHFKGKRNHAETIGKIITFELFLRKFVDRPMGQIYNS